MFLVGTQSEQPAVRWQGLRPCQAQWSGIGLQWLEALGAAGVGLRQGAPRARPSCVSPSSHTRSPPVVASTHARRAAKGSAQRVCQRRRRCTAVRPCCVPPSLHGSATRPLPPKARSVKRPAGASTGSSTSASSAGAPACASSRAASTGCQACGGQDGAHSRRRPSSERRPSWPWSSSIHGVAASRRSRTRAAASRGRRGASWRVSVNARCSASQVHCRLVLWKSVAPSRSRKRVPLLFMDVASISTGPESPVPARGAGRPLPAPPPVRSRAAVPGDPRRGGWRPPSAREARSRAARAPVPR